ncbi:MAG: hypothetical protein MK102_16000 [Fuerstiella sp.]|nr:hypothetical protein [Fuerstiella sp.]
MANAQVPIQANSSFFQTLKRHPLTYLGAVGMIVGAVGMIVVLILVMLVTLLVGFLGFFLVGAAVSNVSGSIALAVLCISTFCSYRHTRKQVKLRKTQLKVRLDTPREGLALVAGTVELPPQATPMTCEITKRECVAYSFTLQEVRQGGMSHTWFKESRTVPFVIRSEFGTARVIGPLEPVPSTIASDSLFADLWFLQRNQLTQKFLCKYGGKLQQNYAEVMPGEYVTLLGNMSVDSEGGALLEDAKFSTQANPRFPAVDSAGNLERLPAFLILGFVIPLIYLVGMLFILG